jgi:hypothetical protein
MIGRSPKPEETHTGAVGGVAKTTQSRYLLVERETLRRPSATLGVAYLGQ